LPRHTGVVSGPLFSPYADFWREHYGITSYDEFRVAVEQVVPEVGPFKNFGLTDTFAAEAWENPYAPAGVAMQLYFSRQGIPGANGVTYQGAVDTATDAGVRTVGAGMAGTLIIPGAFQVTINANVGGQTVDNVIGVTNGSGNAAGAAAAVQSAWETAGGPLQNLTNAYEVLQYQAVDLSSSTGAIAEIPSTATGEDTENGIATRGACVLFKWNGSSRSRSTRGRMYLGPLTSNCIQADGATLTDVIHTSFNNNVIQFLGILSDAGYPLAVLSRVLSVATPVSSHTTEQQIATQRRRIRD
jgi:hypothetical protein